MSSALTLIDDLLNSLHSVTTDKMTSNSNNTNEKKSNLNVNKKNQIAVLTLCSTSNVDENYKNIDKTINDCIEIIS